MTRDPRYDVLFEPVRIGPVTAKNRFYQVPHCSGSGYRFPHTLAAMRRVKAEGGWAVVNTEWCTVHPSSDTTPTASARLWTDEDIETNALMTAAVHEAGALAGCQLAHAGLQSHNRYTRIPPMGPTPRPQVPEDFPGVGRAMDKDDIGAVRRWHRNAVRRAIQAEFDLVYIYAAHAITVFADFLSPRVNQRSDEYGGSLENRVRLLRETLEEVRDEARGRAAVALRLCVDEQMGPGALGAEEGRAVVEILAEMPDLWDVTIGAEDDMLGSRYRKEGWQEAGVRFVKQVSSKPVVGVGRFTSPDTMAAMVRRGVLDMVGAARPSIADPFLPKKIEEGRIEDIRECIGCNICLASHYITVPIRCTQNPTMSEEWRRGWHPEKIPEKGSDAKVLVVGAGPAGLEAARAAGARGYEVILAEAGRELGGHLNAFATLPGFAEWLRGAGLARRPDRKAARCRGLSRERLDGGRCGRAGCRPCHPGDRILLAAGRRGADEFHADRGKRVRSRPLPGRPPLRQAGSLARRPVRRRCLCDGRRAGRAPGPARPPGDIGLSGVRGVALSPTTPWINRTCIAAWFNWACG